MSHDNVDYIGLLIKITFFCTCVMVVKFLSVVIIDKYEYLRGACGGIVVKALHYKPAGRGFDS